MASIIRVKRSTGVSAPSSLSFGELALTTGTGTQANKGDRLFIGYNGDVQEIGGKYYTDLLDHAHGVLTASSAVILDNDSKISQWNVDNLRLDGNALTSTDVDGHITITPNGTGRVQFLDNDEVQFGTSDDIRLSYDTAKDALFFERGGATGGSPDIRIGDDIQFQFGSNNSASIYYDAAGLTNSVQVEGVDWNFTDGVAITISDTTQSTDKDTGALVVEGGVGIEKNLNVGGKFNLGGSATLSSDLSVSGVSTFTGSIDANGDLDVDGHTELDNVNVSGVSTFVGIATFNSDVYVQNQLYVGGISIGGASFGEDIETRNVNASGIITATGIIDANGGAEVKNINIGITGPNEIDTATGNLTIDSAGGTVTVDDQLVVTGISTFNSDTTFNGSVDIDVDLNVDGNVSITGVSTFTGGIDANGGATIDNIQIGITNNDEIDTVTGNLTLDSAGGTVTVDDQLIVTGISTFNSSVDVDNNLDIGGNLTVDGNITLGDSSTNDTITLNARFVSDLIPSTNGTRDLGSSSREWRNLFVDGLAELDDVNVSSAATISTLSVTNSISIGGNQTLTGDLTVQGNTTLGNQSTDSVVITGVVTHIGALTNVGGATFDSVGISSNVISTKSGSGNTLFIDPYPDGLSNEGTVVIKGDLQVDGTTTTVNSVNVTTNNPIYVLGDNVTNRTVASAAGVGTDLLTLDSVAGINTNDIVTGTNIPSNTVIDDIDSGNKVITLSNAIIGSIDSESQITISQGLDTNDDKGIAFKYVSSGIGTEVEIKTGFFGFDDSNYRWTYIPDAIVNNNVVSGTRGYLDIKGIFYQSGDFNANGISYFDSNGQLTSTVAPGSGISTSTYILTTDESGVPTWTDTIDGGVF